MANEKISQFPSGNPAQSTDLTVVARSGANYSLTLAQLIALFASAINFEWLTTGTNTQAAMTVGSGATLEPSGSGIIEANEISGVVISGTPSTGQVLTATGSAAADWQTPASAPVQVPSITQATGNTSVPQNSATVILSKSITMPASGGPFRVFGSYGLYLDASAAGIAVAWIDDSSSNQFATAQALVTGSASDYGVNGSSFSPTTYANSAVVTFSLYLEVSNSGGVTVNQNNNSGFPGAQASWLNLAALPSA